MSPEEPAAQIRALERELVELRRRRIAAQKRANERAGIETAIERTECTERDRSARSSPEVERERDQAQRLHDELAALFDAHDRIRIITGRLRGRNVVDTAPVEDALYTELDFRIDLQRRADDAGVALTIPYVPKHPDHPGQPGQPGQPRHTGGRGNPARTESS